MRTFEDDCVGCPPEMGCLGSSCPRRRVLICTCDRCNESFDPEELYVVGGEDLCEDCLLNEYETVAQEIEYQIENGFDVQNDW